MLRTSQMYSSSLHTSLVVLLEREASVRRRDGSVPSARFHPPAAIPLRRRSRTQFTHYMIIVCIIVLDTRVDGYYGRLSHL